MYSYSGAATIQSDIYILIVATVGSGWVLTYRKKGKFNWTPAGILYSLFCDMWYIIDSVPWGASTLPQFVCQVPLGSCLNAAEPSNKRLPSTKTELNDEQPF